MKKGMVLKTVLAIVSAIGMVLSPVSAMQVQADEATATDETTYTAFNVAVSEDPSVSVGYYIRENGTDENGNPNPSIRVYCLNGRQLHPYTGTNDNFPLVSNYEQTVVEGSEIDEVAGDRNPATSNNSEGLSGEALRRQLIAILLNGHKNDGAVSALASVHGLNDQRFDWMATQLAIWHFTDNYEMGDGNRLIDTTGYLLKHINKGNLSSDVQAKLDQILRAKTAEEAAAIWTEWEAGDEEQQSYAELGKVFYKTKLVYESLIKTKLENPTVDSKKYELLIYESAFEGIEESTDKVFIDIKPAQNLANANVIEKEKKEIILSKQQAGGGPELAGAKLELYLLDELNPSKSELLEAWISGADPVNEPDGHKFKVYAGGTYKLVETQAPKNFAKPAESEWIEFKVNEDGTVELTNGSSLGKAGGNKIVMYNTQVTRDVVISKTILGQGDELEGAELSILDSTGMVIKQWTSTGEAQTFTLAPGTYKLIENQAPVGYETAEMIVFEVTEDFNLLVNGSSALKVEMKDAPEPKLVFSISKYVSDNPDVDKAGARFIIVDGEKTETEIKEIQDAETARRNGEAEETQNTEGTPVLKAMSLNAADVTEARTLTEEEAKAGWDTTDTATKFSWTVTEASQNAEASENGGVVVNEYTLIEAGAPEGYDIDTVGVRFRTVRYMATGANGDQVPAARLERLNRSTGKWDVVEDSHLSITDNPLNTPEDPKDPEDPKTPTTPTTPTTPSTPTTPTTPVVPSTPVTVTPTATTTSGETAAVQGAVRGLDSAQVLGATRTTMSPNTADNAPIVLLMVVMAVSIVGAIGLYVYWTLTEARSYAHKRGSKPQKRAHKR